MAEIPLDKVNMLRLMLASMLRPNEGAAATPVEIVQLVEGLLQELQSDLATQGESFIESQIQRVKGQGGAAS
jgi:hypothetical protein